MKLIVQRDLIYGDFGELGQTQGTVSILNDLAVAGDLYIDGIALN